MAKEMCVDCGKVAEHKLTMVKCRERVINEYVEGIVPCMVCQNCGDGYFLYDEEFAKKVAESKRRQLGFLSGTEIKAIREKKGLNIPEFINLMQSYGGDCSAECFEHFESDTLCQNERNENALRQIALSVK